MKKFLAVDELRIIIDMDYELGSEKNK